MDLCTIEGLILTPLRPAAAGGAPASQKAQNQSRIFGGNTGVGEMAFALMHRSDPYVMDVVLGESRPLSELLLVVTALSSATAIDIIRSSSGMKYKARQDYL